MRPHRWPCARSSSGPACTAWSCSRSKATSLHGPRRRPALRSRDHRPAPRLAVERLLTMPVATGRIRAEATLRSHIGCTVHSFGAYPLGVVLRNSVRCGWGVRFTKPTQCRGSWRWRREVSVPRHAVIDRPGEPRTCDAPSPPSPHPPLRLLRGAYVRRDPGRVAGAAGRPRGGSAGDRRDPGARPGQRRGPVVVAVRAAGRGGVRPVRGAPVGDRRLRPGQRHARRPARLDRPHVVPGHHRGSGPGAVRLPGGVGVPGGRDHREVGVRVRAGGDDRGR